MTKIHALAFHMLGDQMAAEDVTQTVFLKTWQNAKSWEPGRARLLTWMRRVATNACLDHLRKKKPVYTDTYPEIADAGDTPYDALNKTQTARTVKSAMAALPDRQRAALSLSYYQGVSQKEGAKILEVSESAYESLLVRARKTLKAALNDQRQTLEMGLVK